jgi:hypothetical protein
MENIEEYKAKVRQEYQNHITGWEKSNFRNFFESYLLEEMYRQRDIWCVGGLYSRRYSVAFSIDVVS